MLFPTFRSALLLAIVASGATILAADPNAAIDRRTKPISLSAPLAVTPSPLLSPTIPNQQPSVEGLKLGPEGSSPELVVLNAPGRSDETRRMHHLPSTVNGRSEAAPAPRHPDVIPSEALQIDLPVPEPSLASLRPSTASIPVDPEIDGSSGGDPDNGSEKRGRRGGFRIGITVGNGCRIDGSSATRFVFDRGRVGGIAVGRGSGVRF